MVINNIIVIIDIVIFSLFDRLNGNIVDNNKFNILEPSNGWIGNMLNVKILVLYIVNKLKI